MAPPRAEGLTTGWLPENKRVFFCQECRIAQEQWNQENQIANKALQATSETAHCAAPEAPEGIRSQA